MARKHRTVSGLSQRQLRVGEELRHLIAALLLRQETHIPELDTVSITVSEVSVSPDFSNASVYIMTLGGVMLDIVLPALNVAAPQIGHAIAGKVHLRRMPKLKFFADTSYENAAKISQVFAVINEHGDTSKPLKADAGLVSDDGAGGKEYDQSS